MPMRTWGLESCALMGLCPHGYRKLPVVADRYLGMKAHAGTGTLCFASTWASAARSHTRSGYSTISTRRNKQAKCDS